MRTPPINSISEIRLNLNFQRMHVRRAQPSCSLQQFLAWAYTPPAIFTLTTTISVCLDSSVCLADFQTLELVPKRNRFGTNQPKNPIGAKNVLKISVTSSNLDTLGCCWSCRCDPFRQRQNRNTIWHTGVISVEYVRTFAWNDLTRMGIVKCQRLRRVLVLLDWVLQIFRYL